MVHGTWDVGHRAYRYTCKHVRVSLDFRCMFMADGIVVALTSLWYTIPLINETRLGQLATGGNVTFSFMAVMACVTATFGSSPAKAEKPHQLIAVKTESVSEDDGESGDTD